MNKLKSGIILISLCIIIGLVFFIPAYGEYYTTHPALFLTVTIAGIAASFVGSYWIRDALFGGLKRGEFYFRLLGFLGDMVTFMAALAGLVALYGAFSMGVVSGFWGWNWGQLYYISYNITSVTGFNIFFLRLTMVLAVIGQGLVAVSHKRIKG